MNSITLSLLSLTERGWFFPIFLILLVLLGLALVSGHGKQDYHSNWNILIPNFKFSTKEFYKLLKEELSSHQVKGLHFDEVYFKSGGVLSKKRIYLRIEWDKFYYDICFAPFGDGCFVSWWLIFKTSGGEVVVSKIPFIGAWLQRTLYPKTYYKIDSASMFMTYAQNSVSKIIEQITQSTGFRLSEDQKKPKLNDLFKR